MSKNLRKEFIEIPNTFKAYFFVYDSFTEKLYLDMSATVSFYSAENWRSLSHFGSFCSDFQIEKVSKINIVNLVFPAVEMQFWVSRDSRFQVLFNGPLGTLRLFPRLAGIQICVFTVHCKRSLLVNLLLHFKCTSQKETNVCSPLRDTKYRNPLKLVSVKCYTFLISPEFWYFQTSDNPSIKQSVFDCSN